MTCTPVSAVLFTGRALHSVPLSSFLFVCFGALLEGNNGLLFDFILLTALTVPPWITMHDKRWLGRSSTFFKTHQVARLDNQFDTRRGDALLRCRGSFMRCAPFHILHVLIWFASVHR